MRTIKFRGKDIMDDHWVYGDLHILCDRPHIHTDPTAYPYAGRRSFIDPATIGQFTGLHDKNRTEIYEGDLLLSEENAEVFEVVYDAPRFCFKDNVFGFRFLNHPEFFHVIGNIHDNPDLFEKGGKQ